MDSVLSAKCRSGERAQSDCVVLLRYLLLLLAGLALGPGAAQAQQNIGYIDSEYLLERTPEYETIQQEVDQLAEQWRAELEEKQQQVQALREEYQARELLYTEEEQAQKLQEIRQAEQEAQQLRTRYFGPEGQLFAQQRELMRPLQERILEAVETVARQEGYDYVFDKSGEFLFMYANEQHNLNDQVLSELGIDIEGANQGG